MIPSVSWNDRLMKVLISDAFKKNNIRILPHILEIANNYGEQTEDGNSSNNSVKRFSKVQSSDKDEMRMERQVNVTNLNFKFPFSNVI